MKVILNPTLILLTTIFPFLHGCNQIVEFYEAHAGTHKPAEEGHGTPHGSEHKDAHSGEHGDAHAGGHAAHVHKIIVTSPVVKNVTTKQQYVCQIHSRKHIHIRALEGGYLKEVPVNEGQAVEEGALLFKIVPTLFQAKLDSEKAERDLAQIEYNNIEKLLQQNVVSPQELALAKAKLNKAQAKVDLAQAELNFTEIKAPFKGIVDRLHEQLGSLIEEGDMLTTLSDNEKMWVYFNVPEARYLEYKAEIDENVNSLHIELMLANGKFFGEVADNVTIEGEFNNETGNIAFRADFKNPKRLLRHGQTGTVFISHEVKDALVIPQRATYEILAKRYVYVVGDDNIVHQRDIEVDNDHFLDDLFLIKDGVKPGEKIVLEGVRQVRDGDKVDYEFKAPEEVLENLKFKAE